MSLIAILLFIYAVRRATPTEVREAIKSYAIMGSIALVLVVGIPYVLLLTVS